MPTAAQTVKVITIDIKLGANVAEELQTAVNTFLTANPGYQVIGAPFVVSVNNQVHVMVGALV